MKPRFLILAMVLATCVAFPAFALDLHEARHKGFLGEKLDGYVEVLKNTPEVAALAAEVNEKRRVEYVRISRENNQPVEIVAKLAAGQIIDQLDTGDQYQDSAGRWKTR